MDVKRRELIKGITATAAFSIAAPSMTFASPIERAIIHLRQSSASIIKPKPMTALVHRQWENSTFAAGLRAAKPEQTLIIDDIAFDSMRELLTQNNTHLVGIIDYGNAAVLTQLTRQFSANIHWLGQHAFDENITRHNILKSGNSAACDEQLVNNLSTCDKTHYLLEQGITQRVIVGANHSHHPQAWAAELALSLNALSNKKAPAHCDKSLIQCELMQGSAATFFIETC